MRVKESGNLLKPAGMPGSPRMGKQPPVSGIIRTRPRSFSLIMNTHPPVDVTFDPATSAEWRALTELGQRMVEDMMVALQSLPNTPAWRPIPEHIRNAIHEPVPHVGIGPEAVYAQFVERVLPYPSGNWHPRFFGWVQGNGTPLAMLADMLAAGFNPHLRGFNQAPADVEQVVIHWLAELMGLPGASGLFVTGGSMANTNAVAVARHAAAKARGYSVRTEGIQAWPGEPLRKPLVFYGSVETHGWAQKAAEWLGLGRRAFRQVPVDRDYRIDVDALNSMIAADRLAGLDPFGVIGNAGTVNTGATDDLSALAAVCKRESLWFHVDGAFGALVVLSDALRPMVRGLELADSLAFDLHKWGSMPFDCACALVRDGAMHHEAFQSAPAYLTNTTRGVSADRITFADLGIDLTRNFKALKVWMQFKADGVDKFARIIEQNVAQVRYLVARVEAHAELELLAPAPLNIACLRYCAAGLSSAELDALNQELLLRLQERGIAVPSSTRLAGRFAIRVAHVNHRTQQRDIDMMVDAIVAIGRELLLERGTP